MRQTRIVVGVAVATCCMTLLAIGQVWVRPSLAADSLTHDWSIGW